MIHRQINPLQMLGQFIEHNPCPFGTLHQHPEGNIRKVAVWFRRLRTEPSSTDVRMRARQEDLFANTCPPAVLRVTVQLAE